MRKVDRVYLDFLSLLCEEAAILIDLSTKFIIVIAWFKNDMTWQKWHNMTEKCWLNSIF